MEGLLENLFITHSLPQHYNQEIFAVISSMPYQQFRAQQQSIFDWLGRDSSARKRYFQKFQRNHLALYGWYLLSSREKIAIEPYLFHPILQRTPSFENSKVSKAIHSNFPHRSSRHEPNPVRKLFSTQRCREKQPSPEEINSHELYLHTFAACNGQKYIPYDYNRHINSAKEKQHYNAFIRQSHKQKRNTTSEEQPINVLSKYKEWVLSKEKTSLISFRAILADKSLNSQRGLQSLLKRQGSRKLVFVNHQRKPVNYYLRSQLRNNA